MNKVKEPLFDWGGNWTETKLETFQSYVDSYLKIMNSQKKRYNGWPTTIYFDGFAGSGSRTSFNDADINLFQDYFAKEEEDLYKGAAERVLKLTRKFDYYFFVDSDKKAIKLLEEMLDAKNLVTPNCVFIPDDVNNQLVMLSSFINSEKAALVLLDPFGMQINWSSIELMKNRRVDIWILIPTGVIINRFLDRRAKLLFIKKLELYFGLSQEEILKKFYDISNVETLFGTETNITKTNNAIKKIAEVYIQKLGSIFKYISEKPLVLYNSKNFPIYHFVFASNNKTAYNIANQIIEKKRK